MANNKNVACFSIGPMECSNQGLGSGQSTNNLKQHELNRISIKAGKPAISQDILVQHQLWRTWRQSYNRWDSASMPCYTHQSTQMCCLLADLVIEGRHIDTRNTQPSAREVYQVMLDHSSVHSECNRFTRQVLNWQLWYQGSGSAKV